MKPTGASLEPNSHVSISLSCKPFQVPSGVDSIPDDQLQIQWANAAQNFAQLSNFNPATLFSGKTESRKRQITIEYNF